MRVSIGLEKKFEPETDAHMQYVWDFVRGFHVWDFIRGFSVTLITRTFECTAWCSTIGMRDWVRSYVQICLRISWSGGTKFIFSSITYNTPSRAIHSACNSCSSRDESKLRVSRRAVKNDWHWSYRRTHVLSMPLAIVVLNLRGFATHSGWSPKCYHYVSAKNKNTSLTSLILRPKTTGFKSWLAQWSITYFPFPQ
jgi:hypothetical protein